MSSQILLSGGDKWYSYSGIVFGDVSVPASISMVLIPNTGLRDSYIQIQPFFATPVSASAGNSLGLEIQIDNTTILKQAYKDDTDSLDSNNTIILFVPRQSKLEILSLNTSGNNTQERGVNLLGYYL